MQGTITKALLVASAIGLTACSSMQEVPERKTFAEPSWYQECATKGKEGWFWATKEYVYACGSGESRYQQAAVAQAETVALDSFAKRINTKVNSSTKIDIDNDKKTTRTLVSSSVSDTAIRDHSDSQKYSRSEERR